MTDRELLELIAAQVGKLTTEVAGFKNDLSDVKTEIKKTHMAIEHDVEPKLGALFDGQKQLKQKLERIEEEVSICSHVSRMKV